MTTQPARRSIFSRLPATILAAAALTAMSLLLLGYEAVGAQRLGLLDLQAFWASGDQLLTSAVGWHVLMGSFDRGLQALLPGASLMPGIAILTLVCWLAWGYAALFILRQASHAEVGRDSLAWLGVLFILPAAAIMVPLLYIQLAPAGQSAGQAGFLGLLTDLVAVALVIFLAGILLLPRRIALSVVAGQALTWGLIYAAALWGLKFIGVPALGPLVMLVVVLFLLSLVSMLALQRATDTLASLADLGASQSLEYGLMVLAGLAASKDKIAASDLAARAQVPQAETDELLRRFKDASLARMTQGRWAGVWPAERIRVEAVASALGLSGKIAAASNTPLLSEAHSLGWQGVSLADLIAMPSEAVRKAPQDPNTLEAIDAQSASAMPIAARSATNPADNQPAGPIAGHSSGKAASQAAALSAVPAGPAPAPQPTSHFASHSASQAPQPSQDGGTVVANPALGHTPDHGLDDQALDQPADGHRMVRSFEASPPHQPSPQNRALNLALGRPAGPGQEAGIVGAGDYDVMVSGHSPWQAGKAPWQAEQGAPQQGQDAGIAGAQDHTAMLAGVSPWRDGVEPQQDNVEPNDDSVTLDAIRREIQALMDDKR